MSFCKDRLLRSALLASLAMTTNFAIAAQRLPTNVTILTHKDFLGKPVYTVADALEGVAGLNIERDGSPGTRTRLKIRGASSSNRTLVLIDGVPLTHEFEGDVDLTQVPLEAVERIEITRGGASVSYGGDASAGTVNIVMGRPERKGLVADIHTAVGRDGAKDSSALFHGRSNWGDLTYGGDRQASGGFQENEDFKAEHHYAKISRSFNGKGFWGADYYHNESRVGLSNGTPQPIDVWNGHLEQDAITPNAERQQKLQQANLRLASPKIKEGVFYLNIKHGWRDLEEYDVHGKLPVLEQNNTASQLDLSFRRHGFEAGVEALRTKRDTSGATENKSHQQSGYLLQKWEGERWTVLPGLRYDDFAEGDARFSPRITLMTTAGDHWLFSANAAQGFRRPNFDELFMSSTTTSNPDLDSEKSTSYDVGIQWAFASLLQFRVTGFKSTIDDLITVSNLNRYENSGEEKNQGIETEISMRLEKTKFSVNWTSQKSERDTPQSNGFVQSAMTPEQFVNFRIDQELPLKTMFSNEVYYQSEQFSGDDHTGQRAPSYYTWNMRFTVRMWTATAYLAMKNVTNQHYADNILTGLSPQPARAVWTGITIRFIN